MSNIHPEIREDFHEMLKQANEQPGVLEVMQMMRSVSQYQTALANFRPAIPVRVVASSSSNPLPTFSLI